jgi:hypothetical protein
MITRYALAEGATAKLTVTVAASVITTSVITSSNVVLSLIITITSTVFKPCDKAYEVPAPPIFAA